VNQNPPVGNVIGLLELVYFHPFQARKSTCTCCKQCRQQVINIGGHSLQAVPDGSPATFGALLSQKTVIPAYIDHIKENSC